MCKAFSCLVHRNKDVFWKLGVDNHHKLVEMCKWKDNTYDPARMTFARIEITPKNKDYLFPDEWKLQVDERIRPYWFSPAHEEACFVAHKLWLKELDKHLIKKPIIHPFNDITPPKRFTKKIKNLLYDWDSVWDSIEYSIGDYVWDSIRDSIEYSVGDSVWDSIEYSVWYSIKDSIEGYTGSFFKLKKWKYVKHTKGEYPFTSVVELWEMGLVPSFDGEKWRLHGGKDGKVLFEITEKDLKKYGDK